MSTMLRMLVVVSVAGCAGEGGTWDRGVGSGPEMEEGYGDDTRPAPIGWHRIAGNGDTVIADLSEDGLEITFSSLASDLIAADTNGAADAFLARLEGMTGAMKIRRVSVSSDGLQAREPLASHQAEDWSFPTAISSDGWTVGFVSQADNLVPADTNGMPDVFVHDVKSGITSRANLASDGTESAQENMPAGTLSRDGRYVAFHSTSYSLVPDPGCAGVYLRDTKTGTTEQVSLTWDGRTDTGCSYWGNGAAVISSEASAVAFTFRGGDLVQGVWADHIQVFARDLAAGETWLVSATGTGQAGNAMSESPDVSADGRTVSFWSAASDLVGDDLNEAGDIFVRERDGGLERVSVSSDGAEADGDSYSPSISESGRYVVFVSSATNLVGGDENGVDDVFVHDRLTGRTARVSVAMDGGEANGASGPAVISGDGLVIGFSSAASNLMPADHNRAVDLFLVPNPLAY